MLTIYDGDGIVLTSMRVQVTDGGARQFLKWISHVEFLLSSAIRKFWDAAKTWREIEWQCQLM